MHRSPFSRILWGLLLCIGSTVHASDADRTGKQINDFSLKSHLGREYSLHDFADRKVVVLAFLGTECPLAKLYGPRLAELAATYGPRGVAFVGIDSNSQDSLREIATYARTSGIDFPLLKDLENAVADKLGATRTPEVFVLDKDRVVRYSGRIDDRCGVGYVRDKIEHDYLATALDRLLAGKTVETTHVDAVGCLIGRSRARDANSDVTYCKQISRIFQDHCVSCHRPGEIAPFSLTDYGEAAGWADMIQEVVREKRMPPWHANPKYGHFRNDISLSEADKETIYKWVAAGAPKGNPADLPEPRRFAAGWNLPREPDLVLNVQPKPYLVPARGVLDYQKFTVDPGFTEDKWVTASQIIPGNATVVHHVLCFVEAPGHDRSISDENGLGYVAAYVPGYRVTPFPWGMAKHVPAGSKLVFQMHYTPVGREQLDLSKIGFIFADPKQLTHMVTTISTANRGICIPPHAEDYKREATMSAYKHDLNVLSFMPHMHLRGKSFSYEAIYPDGKREMLLDVPRFDFNWQTCYELAETKTLPPGTRVHCVAHWDNSKNNLANPNPAAEVSWGNQTFEEMMIGFFDVATPIDRAKLLAKGGVPRLEPVATLEDRARDLISQFDRNGDGKLSKDELPAGKQRLFGLLDRNHDGFLDVDEVMAFIKATGGKLPGPGAIRRDHGGGDRKTPAAPTEKPAGRAEHGPMD
jgi:peroxiredoxin/mono/diheme cytochrome c family protein